LPASRKPALCCRILLLLAVALATTITIATPAPSHAASGGVFAQDGQRGVAFVQSPQARFGSQASFDSLQKLHSTGATWISVIATFHVPGSNYASFQRTPADPQEDEIAQVVNYAHSLGMRVMIQPVAVSDDGAWSGTFLPPNADEWFRNYKAMLGGYTHVAQETKADEFCIGTEFVALTQPQYSWHWRDVIADIRQSYSGPLTYSANWGKKPEDSEYATIDWWDQVDYIGISAYFPLSWNDFTTDSLRQGWSSYTDPFGPNAVGLTYHWHDQIAAVQARWNKPIQFTRIGFGSYANSPGRWDLTPDPYLELTVQANAYDATFQAWADTSWLTGLFWTPWSSDPNAGGPLDNGDSPQNKPAEQILQKWYGQQ
jgi:hypothetical protein